MLEEIKNIRSGKKELRQFGITLGIILGLLGGLLVMRGKVYYPYFLIVSAAFLLLGLGAPVLLKPIQKIWMSLTILIGWVMIRLILSVLFYLVFTPIGILTRVLGRNFLALKLDKNTPSYWIVRQSARFDKKSYERQF